MARPPIPTWFYALVVVRRGHRFLLVHEKSHEQGWYLPAGRVEAGEVIAEAAAREAHEESGVPVVLEGVLRVEHSTSEQGSRVRVIYVARPKDDTEPRSVPDAESLGARWVAVEDLAGMTLRGGDEVPRVLRAVLDGAPAYPLSVIAAEGAEFPATRDGR